MLSVKNISKSYGPSAILSDVSFALGKGEKVALVGPNGVGKTTLLVSYAGTVILVSHDRYFLEKAKLGTVYLISDGQFSKIADYKEYIESMEKRARKLVRAL